MPGFQVDGTWNVTTTLTFVGCVIVSTDVYPRLHNAGNPAIACGLRMALRQINIADKD
ncbi:MAG: hypothetical protein K9M08_09410 [Pirellula sp.]|nr:hypothetical protein [Pirellula sp.]